MPAFDGQAKKIKLPSSETSLPFAINFSTLTHFFQSGYVEVEWPRVSMLLKIAHSEVSNSSVQIWVLWIFSEVSRSKDFSLLRALRSIYLLEKKMWNILEIFIVDNSIRSDDTEWEWWQCQFPIIITKLLIGSRYKFQYCLCINIYIFSSMSQNIWSKVTETLQSSSEWVEYFTLCLQHLKFNKYRVSIKSWLKTQSET